VEFSEDAVYCLAELAAILRVGRRTAAAIVATGDIPGRKIGQQWRILGASIRAYMTEARVLREGQRGMPV